LFVNGWPSNCCQGFRLVQLDFDLFLLFSQYSDERSFILSIMQF
jgi:hypothetical protein